MQHDARQLLCLTPEDTHRAAARLGRALQIGDVVGLTGPLGSGKTTFVQGISAGLGVPRERHVASPTFALVNEHTGRIPLVHADFYRIKDERELPELGLEEAYGRAAAALEWAERFPVMMPLDHLEITFEFASDPQGGRRLTVRGTGARGEALAQAVCAVL